MKKITLILFAIFLCFSCSNTSEKEGKNKEQVQIPKEDTLLTTEPQTENVSKWEYSSKKDEMDDSETFFAEIYANEKLSFSFPYSGETTAALLLRNKSKKNEVLFQISQGQFMPSYNHKIKVRFDDEAAESYGYDEPSDYSSTTIFINNPKKFISKLKKAKKLIIQCEFYDEGVRNMKFDTEHLEWNH